MTLLLSNAVIPSTFASGEVSAGAADIVVGGDTITSITPHDGSPQPEGAFDEVVDAAGRFVTPGLIDTHVHLLRREHLDALAVAGVTTAVDLGTFPDSLVRELHDATDTAEFLGAGSAASAPGSTQTTHMGFPPESVVTGPEDAERFVAWRVENGAQVVKIIVEDPRGPVPGLAPETIGALVAAAHARDLLTVAHVVTKHSFTMGLIAGVDILTHAPMDAPLDEEQVERMLAQGTICSPTLVMMKGVAAARAGAPGPALSLDAAIESVRRLHDAGVPIVAGTDANDTPHSPSPVAHGAGLHEELDLLVQAGLSPAEAITAATSAAAHAMGLHDRGVLAPGKRADLVLFADDPTVDVAHGRGVEQVWIGGRRVR